MTSYTHYFFTIIPSLVLAFVLSSNVVASTSGANTTVLESGAPVQSKGDVTPPSCLDLLGGSSWYLGEPDVTGLCNQFYAVYTNVPIAMLYKTNLILGPMYTRLSFTDQFQDFKSKFLLLSFSDFFDFDHFRSFWDYYGIKTLLYNDVSHCLDPSKPFLKQISRQWGTFDDHGMLNILLENNLKLPIPNGTVLRWNFNSKSIHSYNFHQVRSGIFDKSKAIHDQLYYDDLLMKVHRSLKPSIYISQMVTTLMRFMHKQYIAIHIRLEVDRAPSLDDFDKALKLYITNIVESKCLAGYPKHPNGSFVAIHAPHIFLASGIFDTTERELVRRGDIFLSAMDKLGLKKINTRERLRGRLLLHEEYSEVATNQFRRPQLHKEQLAFVDLLIAKASYCFINAHMESSFSYFVTRLNQLDRGYTPNDRDFGYESHQDELAMNWGL